MAGRRVHFVMPAELVERVDAALPEGVSRGEFVRRAVERALEPGREYQEIQRRFAESAQGPLVPPKPLSRAEAFRRATQKR